MNARTLFRLLLAVGLLFCTTWTAFARTPEVKTCDWPAFERNAAEMRAALDSALRISEDQGNTEVPPEAIKEIQQFKNSLSAALDNYFECQPSALPDPQALESDLYKRLGVAVPPAPKEEVYDPKDDGPWTGLYLGRLTFKVEVVPDQRKLIAVLTTFGVPYGDDAELDVFAPGEGGMWTAVVHLTSKPYNSISGAFMAFDYRISPPDAKGNWFVAATHINPWPTSCWQGLFIDAVRPREIGMDYQLFHDKQVGYICNDEAPYLRKISADGFQIQFSISSVDEGWLSSSSVMTYKVSEDEVVRVEPVALNPVNFVDEWIRRSWQEAQGWSAPDKLAALQRRHSILQKGGMGDFVSFRSCSIASLSEVGFAESFGDGPKVFFLVRELGNRYTMMQVSDHATATCRGPNRIETVKDRYVSHD